MAGIGSHCCRVSGLRIGVAVHLTHLELRICTSSSDVGFRSRRSMPSFFFFFAFGFSPGRKGTRTLSTHENSRLTTWRVAVRDLVLAGLKSFSHLPYSYSCLRTTLQYYSGLEIKYKIEVRWLMLVQNDIYYSLSFYSEYFFSQPNYSINTSKPL